jgi:hypothetical protein
VEEVEGAVDDDDDDEDDDEEDEEEDNDDDDEDDDEEDEEEDEGEWEDDEDVGPVGGAADDAGDNNEEEEEEEEDEDDNVRRKGQKGVKKGSAGISKDDGSDDDEDEQPRSVVKRIKKADKAVEQLAEDGVNEEMPHKLPCPANVEEFDELADRYVRSAADFREIITRILAWNSVHLPGLDGTENRGRMHNFLDVLLKVFLRVGDSLGAAGTRTEAGDYEKEVQEQVRRRLL